MLGWRRKILRLYIVNELSINAVVKLRLGLGWSGLGWAGLADDVTDAKDNDDENEGDGDIEEIAPGIYALTQAQEMDAIVGIQQDRP